MPECKCIFRKGGFVCTNERLPNVGICTKPAECRFFKAATLYNRGLLAARGAQKGTNQYGDTPGGLYSKGITDDLE